MLPGLHHCLLSLFKGGWGHCYWLTRDRAVRRRQWTRRSDCRVHSRTPICIGRFQDANSMMQTLPCTSPKPSCHIWAILLAYNRKDQLEAALGNVVNDGMEDLHCKTSSSSTPTRIYPRRSYVKVLLGLLKSLETLLSENHAFIPGNQISFACDWFIRCWPPAACCLGSLPLLSARWLALTPVQSQGLPWFLPCKQTSPSMELETVRAPSTCSWRCGLPTFFSSGPVQFPREEKKKK